MRPTGRGFFVAVAPLQVRRGYFNVRRMKAFLANLRKEVTLTCWEFKFHLFKALVLPTFTYGTENGKATCITPIASFLRRD